MRHTYTTTIEVEPEVEPEDADVHEAVVVVTLDEWHPFVAATRYEPPEGGWEGVSVTVAGEPMSERHPNYDWLVDLASQIWPTFRASMQDAHREEREHGGITSMGTVNEVREVAYDEFELKSFDE